LGISVVAVFSNIIAPTQHSASYLEAKRLRMDHDLPVERLVANADAE